MVNLVNELIDENDDYAVVNIAQPLTSATYDSSWDVIHQAVNDAYNEYMVGQIDMAGFEAVVEEQRSQGMDDVIAEYTASYDAAQCMCGGNQCSTQYRHCRRRKDQS